MSVFKQPLDLPPGPRAQHNPNREADTMRALGEVRIVLEKLINALAPYQPTSIVDATGRRKGVLAFDQGEEESGTRLHNVTGLTAGLTDPFDIAASVISAVIGSITPPDPSDFVENLSALFITALGTVAEAGASPEREDVKALVDTYLGSIGGMIGDIGAAVAAQLASRSAGIDAILADHFGTPGTARPRNGDYIYTEAAGIVYVLFKQKGGIPSSNTIFRVPFTVGGTTWVALTTFPAPNIEGFAISVATLAIAAVETLLILLANLLTDTLMALFALIEAVRPLITDLIEAALDAVYAAIAAVQALVTALTARVTAIEELLENITTIDAIDTAGDAQTIIVLGATSGGSVLNDVTWIDSSTGAGFSAQWPIWNGPNTNLQDVDWRTMYWMGQDGSHWAAKVLMLLTDGYPKIENYSPGPLYNPVQVVTCDNGEITILKLDDE